MTHTQIVVLVGVLILFAVNVPNVRFLRRLLKDMQEDPHPRHPLAAFAHALAFLRKQESTTKYPLGTTIPLLLFLPIPTGIVLAFVFYPISTIALVAAWIFGAAIVLTLAIALFPQGEKGQRTWYWATRSGAFVRGATAGESAHAERSERDKEHRGEEAYFAEHPVVARLNKSLTDSEFAFVMLVWGIGKLAALVLVIVAVYGGWAELFSPVESNGGQGIAEGSASSQTMQPAEQTPRPYPRKAADGLPVNGQE